MNSTPNGRTSMASNGGGTSIPLFTVFTLSDELDYVDSSGNDSGGGGGTAAKDGVRSQHADLLRRRAKAKAAAGNGDPSGDGGGGGTPPMLCHRWSDDGGSGASAGLADADGSWLDSYARRYYQRVAEAEAGATDGTSVAAAAAAVVPAMAGFGVGSDPFHDSTGSTTDGRPQIAGGVPQGLVLFGGGPAASLSARLSLGTGGIGGGAAFVGGGGGSGVSLSTGMEFTSLASKLAMPHYSRNTAESVFLSAPTITTTNNSTASSAVPPGTAPAESNTNINPTDTPSADNDPGFLSFPLRISTSFAAVNEITSSGNNSGASQCAQHLARLRSGYSLSGLRASTGGSDSWLDS